MTDTLQPCEKCDGTGYEPIPDEPEFDVDNPCPSCLGVGRVPTETVIDKVARAIHSTDPEPLKMARAAVQAYLKETL